ncbi:MAG: transposase Tn5, partial [Bacteriovoracaceae bacterium]|nr:transposase Tn5 [Bacteriovoracaceae bacterium]
KTKGLGPIDSYENLGLIMHSSLALSEQGLPLGLLDQQVWSRPHQPKRLARHIYRQIPIEQKESFKWLKGLRQSHQRTANCEIVTIADRESDFYDFFMESKELEAEFLIRACYDRNVQEELSLREAVEKQNVLGVMEIEIKQDDEMHKVELELRACEVTLQPPEKKNKGSFYRPISVWVVWASEKNPREEERLEWLLLSSLPVRSFEDAQEKIRWYRHRWHIESFHKVLKSGCRIEECRLETVDRLKRYLSLTSVIAWRLYWLTHLHRHHPETPASEILAEPEWKSLYCRIHKTTTLPDTIPTAYQVTRWIAQLGGFLARRGDGEPGITTLWRGWQRLRDITEDYLLFSRENTCG